jgi:hypothetical protein
MAGYKPSDRRWIFEPVVSYVVWKITPKQRKIRKRKPDRAPNSTYETRFETSSER